MLSLSLSVSILYNLVSKRHMLVSELVSITHILVSITNNLVSREHMLVSKR